MNNKTELEKVKAEIESKKEEKEKYEKQLSQLKNQEKKLKKMASLEERKKRTPSPPWASGNERPNGRNPPPP